MIPLVVGGNSGIGLAIVLNMLNFGVQKVYIVGKSEPDIGNLDEKSKNNFYEKVIFKKQNFVSLDLSVFDDINDIDTLIITAGFGRLSLFQNLTETEVKNLLQVNLDANTRIIKRYYDRIAGKKDFYTAVMVSISGYVVSPFFSVYGAAKGGLRFLIENLNCELSANGCKNRILNVSPGHIKGTNFEGHGNDLQSLKNFASLIIEKMYNRETLFIPDYEEVYKGVLDRYCENPEKFGQESYDYKVKSGRVSKVPQVVVGYLSGTFDLFHIGHLNILRRAKEQCDYLIVSVHESGAWKGKETFIPYEERKAIVASINYVDKVVEDFAEDSDAWEKYRYDKLFVGSDYMGTDRFKRYEEILKGKVEIVYLPYTNSTSSTQLRAVLNQAIKG